jgi:hypothetical protein
MKRKCRGRNRTRPPDSTSGSARQMAGRVEPLLSYPLWRARATMVKDVRFRNVTSYRG